VQILAIENLKKALDFRSFDLKLIYLAIYSHVKEKGQDLRQRRKAAMRRRMFRFSLATEKLQNQFFFHFLIF
jgi:hypothetical protein